MLSLTMKRFEDHLMVVSSEWESFLQGEIGALDQLLLEDQAKVQATENLSRHLTSKIDLHDCRLSHIKPLLTSISSGQPSSSHPDLSDVLNRLSLLENHFATGQQPSIAPPDRASQDVLQQVNLLEATLKDQAHQISLLENRGVGAGVKMGDLIFQSFEDLLLWIKNKLPSGRFGFIVDGRSFLEFFTLSAYIDSKLSAAVEHMAEKAGYATYYEMKVAASFNNLFPLIFGKASAGGMDDSDCLPGVSTGDK